MRRPLAAQIDAELGALVQSRRLLAGLSQAQMAETLSVPEALVADWERGEERMPASVLFRVAGVFKTSLPDLYGAVLRGPALAAIREQA